ncbi:MAG TPA: hypothetical protein VH297_03085 [Gaiellaceae bacterium]
MLVRLDAVFEGLLGVVLLLAAATGVLDSSDFPSPVGTVVLLLAGWALLTLCGLIWSGRIGLRELALGNAAGAVAGAAWLLLADGWSAAGAALVGVTVAVLAVLAAVQAATLRA